MKTLYELKPGDPVYYKSRFSAEIMTVTRTTKSTIICANLKFRKIDGRQVRYEPIFPAYIKILTDEMNQELLRRSEREHRINIIENVKLDSLTDNTLEKVYNLIINDINGEGNDKSKPQPSTRKNKQ